MKYRHGDLEDNCYVCGISPSGHKKFIQDLITQAKQETKQQVLEELKSELREYRDKYPDVDYQDIIGYIVGFQNRPAHTALNKLGDK